MKSLLGHAPQASAAPSARAVLLGERFALFAMVAAAACGLSGAGLLAGRTMLPLALGAIALAMWHGAYDQVQAEPLLRPMLGRRWLPLFLAGYVLLAVFTALGWWLLPLASLLLFLAYSSWHFGTESELWTPRPLASAAAVALGAVPIVAACRWHPGEVTAILLPMLHGTPGDVGDAARITAVGGAFCWPVLLTAAAGIMIGLFGLAFLVRAQLLGVLALEAALFHFCDPLLAFAVFFCFWHTPEHLVATSLPAVPEQTLQSRLVHNLRAGLLPWLLSVTALAGMFLLGRREAASYRAEIFITLSALTVPHMVLNELGRASRSYVPLKLKEAGLAS